ncbi:hypothetical protein JOD43_002227 [Pullulanibacillus pueri]|uniref:Uncharacterized protein n=1 Tax=Pullulanibacillus pueri TaxID=1437324 RepID=A0A8J2ZUW9_9BACL|nr:hypothetical protein [Pullulanibacillus pueri]MBM7682054.1 hypothetical protein [Pullulanibacillus pueri]GGH80153.1 hypothetical protein GCM10007096_16140 [Pullulanibacillus pueri]
MPSKEMKITTLFWIAISGLLLTTIYTIVIMKQGIETKKMINFIYKNNKRTASEDHGKTPSKVK